MTFFYWKTNLFLLITAIWKSRHWHLSIGISIGINISIQILMLSFAKYKPLVLKVAFIYLFSTHSTACNMYSCNFSWHHPVLLKPSTFDFVLFPKCLDLLNNNVPTKYNNKVLLTCFLIFVYLYSLTLSVNGLPVK